MIVGYDDTPEKFLNEIVPAAVKKARENGATAIFGFGWDLLKFEKNMPTRQQLDAICSDIPIYFADEEGHKGLANTLMLVNAGIMSADGKVLKSKIRGGEIVMDADGTPTGYLKEQAGTYTHSFLDSENLFSVDLAKEIIVDVEQQLLSEGYTAGEIIFTTKIITKRLMKWTRKEKCISFWARLTKLKVGWILTKI